ncbi:MAG TPA: nucleotidyl transferase AbiEii/AbiGii toxin family protein [Candidatus Woesebacteria bacterium]|nr:nucleotidyl transferase AbiEii/AbiGii toxin family protein [Candidatus Woesebacteria bacterium]
MHQHAIDPQTRQTLSLLNNTELIKTYYLAGGTACALHLGHRLSHDLDFFALNPATPEQIRDQLLTLGDLEIYYNQPGTFNGVLNLTKISFFVYPYQLLSQTKLFENTSVASIEDLICMKLEAIASRGSKRDFVDLYFLLQNLGLDQAINYYQKKYAKQNTSVEHLLKSLVYFNDAIIEPELNMLVEYQWSEVEKFFQQLTKQYSTLVTNRGNLSSLLG